MRTMGSFAATKYTRGFELYLRPAIRTREFQASLIALIVMCVFAAIIVARAWSDISVYVIAWIAFSLFWETQQLRTMARLHGSLQMLLTTQQVDPKDDESPIGAILAVVADVVSQSLAFNFLTVCGLLTAIIFILSKQ
jgi:hypothetical protein